MKWFGKKHNDKYDAAADNCQFERSVSAKCLRLFYLFFALCFSWLSVHIVVDGYYEYREVWLLFLTLCALIILLLVWQLLKKYETVLKKYSLPITIGFLILMFVLQMVLGLRLRYTPVWDVDAIYGGGIEWAETGTFASYYEYFSYFFNNFGGLRFFYWLFRFARTLGIHDYYMAATAANGILSIATMYVTGAVGRRLLGVRGQMMAYVLVLLSPPFYFIAPAFYTDALSMLFPVLMYWLYLQAKDTEKLFPRLLLYGLAGVAAAVGIAIKPTVAIAFVAIIIDALFTWKLKRTLSMTVIILIIVLMGHAALNHSVYRHLDQDDVNEKKTPALHWIMMGLSDSGMYNGTDYNFTRSFESREERNTALMEEIKTRIKTNGVGGMIRLFTLKGEICFGDGTYGLSDCLGGTPVSETKLRDYVVKDSVHFADYQHICMGILLALYLLMIASGFYEFFVLKSESLRMLVPRLAVFGLLLFLICWEARWRYFSNFIPMIFVSALLGLEPLSQAAGRVIRRLVYVWCEPAREPGQPEEEKEGEDETGESTDAAEMSESFDTSEMEESDDAVEAEEIGDAICDE